MSSVTVRILDHPTEDEINQTIAVIDEAFNHNFFNSALGPDPALPRQMMKAHLTAGLMEGSVYVAETPEEGVVGVAIWYGPGKKVPWEKPLDETYLTAGKEFEEVVSQVPPELRAWWETDSKGYSVFNRMSETAMGPGIKTTVWHLHVLGTSPRAQKRGVARALLDVVHKIASAQGLPCYLETLGPPAPHITIYGRLGYSVKGEHPIQVPGGEESVVVTMVKDPIS